MTMPQLEIYVGKPRQGRDWGTDFEGFRANYRARQAAEAAAQEGG